MALVRGRIVNTIRPVEVAPGITAHGVKPRILANVKTGSRRLRDDWEKACRHLGLDAIEVQATGEDAKGIPFVTAFDVTGSPEALESLTERPCVRDWHFILDVTVAHVATGSGNKPKRRM